MPSRPAAGGGLASASDARTPERANPVHGFVGLTGLQRPLQLAGCCTVSSTPASCCYDWSLEPSKPCQAPDGTQDRHLQQQLPGAFWGPWAGGPGAADPPGGLSEPRAPWRCGRMPRLPPWPADQPKHQTELQFELEQGVWDMGLSVKIAGARQRTGCEAGAEGAVAAARRPGGLQERPMTELGRKKCSHSSPCITNPDTCRVRQDDPPCLRSAS